MSGSLADKIPARFQYIFTGSPNLIKDGDYIRLVVRPVWSDAQRPVPADFDRTPQAVLLNEKDFERLWPRFRALDIEALKHAGDADFEPTPPDVRHTERLLLSVDDRIEIDWSHSSRMLKAELRGSLEDMGGVMMAKFEERLKAPAVPDQFRLEMTREEGGRLIRMVLSKEGDSISFDRSDATGPMPISGEDFEDFMRRFQQLRIIKREFGAAGPAGGEGADEPGFGLKADIEQVRAVEFNLAGEFVGKKAFDRLWEEMVSLMRK